MHDVTEEVQGEIYPVTVRFYKMDESDILSKAVYYGGKLFGHDMDLTHVVFEFDGHMMELLLGGLEFHEYQEDMVETRAPDVILTFVVTKDELEAMYVTAEFLTTLGLRVRITDLVRLAFNRPTFGLLCTDLPLLMLGIEPIGMTALELLEVLIEQADKVECSEYGEKLVNGKFAETR